MKTSYVSQKILEHPLLSNVYQLNDSILIFNCSCLKDIILFWMRHSLQVWLNLIFLRNLSLCTFGYGFISKLWCDLGHKRGERHRTFEISGVLSFAGGYLNHLFQVVGVVDFQKSCFWEIQQVLLPFCLQQDYSPQVYLDTVQSSHHIFRKLGGGGGRYDHVLMRWRNKYNTSWLTIALAC